MDKQNKIYWHEAFQEGLQLELHEYKDSLTFDNDHRLSEEALRMDAVVIKKDKNIQVDKNIGRIFKSRNIFEYKSETITFTRWDYNKVLGYAFLYSSFTETPITDITISIALTIFPQKLVQYLEKERGFKIQDLGNGIYYIKGDIIPIQILESKNLSPKENLFLRNLRSDLSAEDLAETLELYKEQRPLDKKSVYLDRLIRANISSFREVMKMTDETIAIIMETLEENGLLAKREVEKVKKIAKKMFLLGDSIEKVTEATELPIDTVISISKELKEIPATV